MWVKIDDAILDNPKILAAGPEGLLLHIAAITWCGRNLSDGLIPKVRVPTLVAGLEALGTARPAPEALGPEEDGFDALDAYDIAAHLVAVGLWHDRGAFWEIHDFLVYNPPREKVLKNREAARVRMNSVRSSRKVRANKSRSSPAPVPVPVPGSEPKNSSPSVQASSLKLRKGARFARDDNHEPERLGNVLAKGLL